MTDSDDFGLEDDDPEFIAAAARVVASQQINELPPSARPTKRRRIVFNPTQIDVVRSTTLRRTSGNQNGSKAGETRPQIARDPDEKQAERAERRDVVFEEDSAYDSPGELPGSDSGKSKSKYKIHVPKDGGQFEDQICTQTQVDLDSSPGRFRGAIWKKPRSRPALRQSVDAVHLDSTKRIQSYCPSSRCEPGRVTGGNLAAIKHACPGQRVPGFSTTFDQDDLGTHSSRVVRAAPVISLDAAPILHIPKELADLPADAFSSPPDRSSGEDAIVNSSQAAAPQDVLAMMPTSRSGLKQITLFGQPARQASANPPTAIPRRAWPLTAREERPTHHRLNEKATETWVYPTNLGTIRDYQYNIVSRSLYHNTLVALPTGLGKTFIAATVMLNFYRWTSDAQIVFMAPTRPLIAQQMEACFSIVGLPKCDTVLMTGDKAPAVRSEEWSRKRVFFTTPHIVVNDLSSGVCDPKRIVLIVVDEAHKATGGYAYTEVIRFLRRFNNSYRVLALTATPGSTVESVQTVIDALSIARVELRTEHSLDIREYTHEKHTETEVFEYSEEQVLIMENLCKALRPVLDKLCTQNAYWSRDPMQLTAYGLTTARQKWMASEAGRKAPMGLKGMINSIFTVLSQVAHGIGLLKNHGIGPFYSTVTEFQRKIDTGETKSKYASQIAQSEDYTKMARTIRGWINQRDFIGHPKLDYLRHVVLSHFVNAADGLQGPDVPPSATRIMIFASYRDSTEDICRVLRLDDPIIRPHVFVGQAASKGSEGMDQKRQNAVIQDFKGGKYNTLVATSIGEEGLDIGDVDLIVCYDASSSPIRMLQRIGRTGRKRVGRVVLLLMKGKEENDYAKAQDNYLYIQRTIADESKYNYHEEDSPRILPKGVNPIVDKRLIEIPIENTQPVDHDENSRRARPKTKSKKSAKRFNMPDGVRTGFVKASRIVSEVEDDSGAGINYDTALVRSRKPASASRCVPNSTPQIFEVPSLEAVLLTESQQTELNTKYAQVAGSAQDIVTRAPDAARYPENIRQPHPTRYMSHGTAVLVVRRTVMNIGGIDSHRVRKVRAAKEYKPFVDDVAGDRRLEITVNEEAAFPTLSCKPPVSTMCPPVSEGSRPMGVQVDNTSEPSCNTDNEAYGNPMGRRTVRALPGRSSKKAAYHVTSHAQMAAEGRGSSPEPTPDWMRIGTQGIDLGSSDTSGEEDEAEAESELEDFIVRSDQSLETMTSSQILPNVSVSPPGPRKHGRPLRKRALRPPTTAVDSDQDDGYSSSEVAIASSSRTSTPDHEDKHVIVSEFGQCTQGAPVKQVGILKASVMRARKRRIVGDSDSDV